MISYLGAISPRLGRARCREGNDGANECHCYAIDSIVSMALARLFSVGSSAVNRINSITYLHNLRASDYSVCFEWEKKEREKKNGIIRQASLWHT